MVWLPVLLGIAAVVQAQPPTPHLGYAYPAGGRRVATVRVTIGGQRLQDAAGVYVSGDGVYAKVSEQIKPLTQQQVQQLREKLRELQKKDKTQPSGRRSSRSARNSWLLQKGPIRRLPKPSSFKWRSIRPRSRASGSCG